MFIALDRQHQCLDDWIQYTAEHQPEVGWLGSGLITLGSEPERHFMLNQFTAALIQGLRGV